MANFNVPAYDYMTSPILTVDANASARLADDLVREHQVSALGVTDDKGDLIGIISRTDLLDSSSAEPGETFRVADGPVSELMTPDPVTAPVDTPLARIAKMMLDGRIHRVFLTRDDEPVGVVSTRDLMRAVYDKRVRIPAVEIATRSTVRVNADDPIALAVDRLERSNKHGLIVVDEGWPIGTFSQRDALEARAHDPRTPVDEVMNLRILVLPAKTALHRAAQQAMAMNVRRILLVEDEIVGVVSTFDFARVVK
jgi:CBS domain-containing protein